MSKKALALLYRPRRFSDVVGQRMARLVLQRMIQTGEIRSAFIFHGSLGSGKAQPLDALVLTPTGFRKMGDLSVGDVVIDPDGQPSQVTGVFPQGEQDIYRVVFNDGSSCECTLDHLWPLRRPKFNRVKGDPYGPRVREYVSEVRTLGSLPKYMLKSGGGWTLDSNLREDLDFIEEDLPIDPYTFGLLIGDGHLSSVGSSLFGSEDLELIESCRVGLESLGVTLVPTGDKRTNASEWFRLVGCELSNTVCLFDAVVHSAGPLRRGLCSRHYQQENLSNRLDQWELVGQSLNVVRHILSNLGCLHLSDKKFIPDIYKFASAKTRLAVLQALLDTDGNAIPGGAEFSSASVQLCADVQWLARSLGFRSTAIRSKSHSYWNVQHQERRVAHDRNRVSVFRSNEMPDLFRLARKRDAAYRDGGRWSVLCRRFVSVEKVRRAEAQCISVSAPSQLYITNDFIPTHNTTMARVLAAGLNCEHEDVKERPCGGCDTCVLVAEGRSPDVTEIDAASTGRADDIRALRERARYAAQGRYRVIILDEVHSLSETGFDALLKTLEEPPPNVVFILVTTDLDGVKDTVVSRCFSCEFTRISEAQLAQRIRDISDAEGFGFSEELCSAIAARSRGVARNAVMLAEQAALVHVRTPDQLTQLLGDQDHGIKLVRSLSAGPDYPAAFEAAHAALGVLPGPREVVAAVVSTLRRLLVLTMVSGEAVPLSPPPTAAERVLAGSVDASRCVASMRVIWEYYRSIVPATDAHAAMDLVVTLLGQALSPASPVKTRVMSAEEMQALVRT